MHIQEFVAKSASSLAHNICSLLCNHILLAVL